MQQNRLFNRQGYKLLEIIVVVVIIGGIAGFGFPKLTIVIEKFRAEEGAQTLLALYAAQKRFALENSGNFTATLGSLDTEIRNLTHFNTPTVATSNPVASIARQDGSYTLVIDGSGANEGRVRCSVTGGTCTKLGF